MTINLGIRAHDVNVHTFKHLFAVTNNYGLNNVQFAPFKFLPKYLIGDTRLYSPGLLNEISHKFEHAHLKISILGNYVNIIDYNEDIRRKNLASFRDSLLAQKYLHAAATGTETGSVKSPIGYTKDNYCETALKRVIDSVKFMANQAEKLGSIVAIEPGVNHPMYTNFAVRRVLDEVNSPNLVVIFDLANMISEQNQHNQAKILEDAARLYGNKIVTFHLKDIKFVNGKKVNVPFGTGIIDIERYINFINQVKPYTYATFEGIKEDDLDESVKLVRKLDARYPNQLI